MVGYLIQEQNSTQFSYIYPALYDSTAGVSIE